MNFYLKNIFLDKKKAKKRQVYLRVEYNNLHFNSDHVTNFFYNNIQLKSGDDHMLLYVIYIVLSRKISIILGKLMIYTSRFFNIICGFKVSLL